MRICRLYGLLLVASIPLAGSAFGQYNLPPGTQIPDTPQALSPAARQLEQAEDKISEGDFAGARSILKTYLQAHSLDARALYDQGYIDQASGSEAEAAAYFRKAIAADPKQFEAHLALGLLLARQGQADEARKQLLQATLLTPSPPDPAAQAQAFRALAALDRTTDPAAARSALLSALRLSPETSQDLLLTAQIAEASGDDSTAEEAYRQLLAKYPGGDAAGQATGGLAHLLMKEGKYQDAETLLKTVLESGGNSQQSSSQASPSADRASLQAQLATALIAQGKDKEALPALEELERLEPENASVKRMLADAYSQAGYPGKAAPFYAELISRQPKDPGLLAAAGKNLIEQQDYEQAQKILDQAVQLKTDDGEAWSSLAFAAFQNQQYAAAIQALSMRAKYMPETAASYFLWAASYDSLQESKSARLYYRKFLAADNGKLPDQEWQARQRLKILDRRR